MGQTLIDCRFGLSSFSEGLAKVCNLGSQSANFGLEVFGFQLRLALPVGKSLHHPLKLLIPQPVLVCLRVLSRFKVCLIIPQTRILLEQGMGKVAFG